jgi:hypothetical protein
MGKAGKKSTPEAPRNLLAVKLAKAAGEKPATPEQEAALVEELRKLSERIVFGCGDPEEHWGLPPDEPVDESRWPTLTLPRALPPAPLPNGTKWIASVVKERRDELAAMSGITAASHELAKESRAACAKQLTPRYIERLLRPYNIWPKVRRNPSK